MLLEKTKIYGVDGVGKESLSILGSAFLGSALSRTDSAVGLGYTILPSEITSSFDKCYPWCEMKEVVDNFGNVFIRIPKFYTKITKNADGTYKHQISGCRYDGFGTLFVDGKGNEIDYILVGKYEGAIVSASDSNYNVNNAKIKSKSGQTVLVNTTREKYRTLCRHVGKGYQQYDFLIDAIIKELFLIEFATTNSQSIMKGFTNGENAAALITGHTDLVKTASGSWNNNHVEDCATCNTDGKHACKYRGIENPFGNVWKWCDGINFDAKKIFVCEDAEFYADDKHDAPFTYMGERPTAEGYLKEVTPFAKNPLLGYATAVGATNMTYYCDYYMGNSGTVLCCGGNFSCATNAGLWAMNGDIASGNGKPHVGGRLCYKPI